MKNLYESVKSNKNSESSSPSYIFFGSILFFSKSKFSLVIKTWSLLFSLSFVSSFFSPISKDNGSLILLLSSFIILVFFLILFLSEFSFWPWPNTFLLKNPKPFLIVLFKKLSFCSGLEFIFMFALFDSILCFIFFSTLISISSTSSLKPNWESNNSFGSNNFPLNLKLKSSISSKVFFMIISFSVSSLSNSKFLFLPSNINFAFIR